jgi:hypothetical protein
MGADMIFPPDNPTDPAEWAAVFAGHVAVGVGLAALAVWAGLPFWAAPVAYLVAWEGVYQRFGAGLWDALVDTWAVALGAGIIWAAWSQVAPGVAAGVALASVSVGLGIWRRM